ncbi:DUF192 domain-containing protein [Nanoarchaeota archaeon]
MQLNTPKGRIDVKICKNSWSKGVGLMFSRPRMLLFDFRKPRRMSLHMFFVFFSIDVYFLDNFMEVIEVKRNFRPFTTYKSRLACNYVLETPANALTLRVGDKLEKII